MYSTSAAMEIFALDLSSLDMGMPLKGSVPCEHRSDITSDWIQIFMSYIEENSRILHLIVHQILIWNEKYDLVNTALWMNFVTGSTN